MRMKSDTLFPMPGPEPRPLNAYELHRLKAAGCGPNELQALASVADEHERALLLEFFCDAAPHNWRKLQQMLSLMLYKVRCEDVRPIGGDILTNAAKFHFPECEGCNDHRLFYPRALRIVRPDLWKQGLLTMEPDAKANVLLECGWSAPETVDWQAIKPAKLKGKKP